MSRLRPVRQHDITDCGAACLWSVATYYGQRMPLSRIRQFASTDRQGTTVLGLLQAAKKLGYQAKGVRAAAEALPNLPTPFIAHVVLPTGLHHFVVVSRIRQRRLRVMDPRDGRLAWMGREEFLSLWSGVLVLLIPGEMFETGRVGDSVAGRFWALLKPHRSVLGQALFGAVIYTLLGLTTAVYVQKVVDYVLVDGNRNLLNLLSLAMLVLIVVQVFVGSMKSVLALRTGQKIDTSLILGYYRHLLRLPQAFFDTMRVGEILSRVGDAVKIRALLNDLALSLAVNALVVFFSLFLMLIYDWRLALVVSAIVPLFGFSLWLVNRINRRVLRTMMESAAELESHLVESVESISTIRRFSLETLAETKIEGRFVRLLRSVYGAGTNSIFSSGASDLIGRVAVVAVLWVGSGYVLDGDLTPGSLMSFYALVGYLTGPAASLVGANRTVQDALIAADRLFEIMDLELEGGDQQVELGPDNFGTVTFEGVSFRYGSRTQVLNEVSFSVPPNQITALVGQSGSGKSTAMALLQKLYSPQAGLIQIGGIDLRYVSSESLRRVVVAVPQQVHLFHATVIENIAVGDAEPDVKRLLELSNELGVTEFVEELPQGFHTVLREQGSDLSGGQRQRLAIARALYRKPRLLILDEATSSLDSLSEELVQTCLRRFQSHGGTVVIITHRLATVVRADNIILLDGGKAVEEGTHAELLRRRGHYAALWRAQQAA
jgi:ATP-binding cassette, subfamily C, bacteriocin exporter